MNNMEYGSKIIVRHKNGYIVEATVDNIYDSEGNRVSQLPKDSYLLSMGYCNKDTKEYHELMKKLHKNNEIVW